MSFAVVSQARVNHKKFERSTQCLRCHPRAKPTHWQQTPEDMQSLLPLDERGRMTCTTCHICSRGTCDLREPKEDLCRTCHDCTTGMGCVLGVAHIGDAKDLKKDSLELCLNCHESVGAPETCALGNRTIHTMLLNTTTGEGAGRRVALIDGEITCLSCHNPYNANEFAKLLKPETNSHLCTTCHSKLQEFDHSEFKEVKECTGCHPRVTPTHIRQKPAFMTKSLPLDEEGRMVCTTCHICVGKTCTIRGEKEQICQVCHDCTRGMACLIGTPHLGSEHDKKEAQIDACRDCHDSVTAPPACRGVRGKEIRERMERTGETCISCHDPYSEDKTPPAKLDAAKRSTLRSIQTHEGAKFCPRQYIEITDEEQCKRCHFR